MTIDGVSVPSLYVPVPGPIAGEGLGAAIVVCAALAYVIRACSRPSPKPVLI
jgi:hypothetical protein